METDDANNRRQMDSEKGIEAMDTQESDLHDPFEIDNLSNNGDANMQVASNADSTTTVSNMDAEEDARSEATFSFLVENFSKMKESKLSPPCYVRNLPWKIMIMPRFDRAASEVKSLGFFLQCNGDSDSTSWSCNAAAELRLKSFKPGEPPFERKIKHLFFSKENDWGFSCFLQWNEVLDPEKGYVQNDKILVEVHVVAEPPHGVYWDSKRLTGFVGLKNQGATCYMNSLLQTLYFTNELRKAVYKMPTEADDSSKSVALALQRVFHDLQFTDKPVGTKRLTKSFGWETLDSFMQHDVQEFLRVLLDKLESKMKETCIEGTVPRLFEGKMMSYIKCKNVECTSQRMETFYDIQLNIKGKKNIYESFEDYVAAETLEGDNKYDAGEHGFQEAEKGVTFVSFPPVLHLHLMRFQYDPITDNSVKFNDRFEFYDEINLDRFLTKKETQPAKYRLHAVLVHSGDNHGGHYVVYINPKGDGKWCKFDDDVVSRCTATEAIEHNYGGEDDNIPLNAKHSNAYMLVYIRVSAMNTVLQEIEENDIPTEIKQRLHEEKRLESVKRRERAEANSYVSTHVILEEAFEGHQSTDLFNKEIANYRIFKMKKSDTIDILLETLSETFKVPRNRMRIWPLVERSSNIIRPLYFNAELKTTLAEIVGIQNPWIIFFEIAPADTINSLPIFDRECDLLIFFKFYDPYEKRLNYGGYMQYPLQKKLIDIIPDINIRLGFPDDTELSLYEEIGPNAIQRIYNLNDTLDKAIKTGQDDIHSSILIFEKKHFDEKLELPTCEHYFRDLHLRIEVTFIDKCNPNDPGFTLDMSQQSNYLQMAGIIGKKLNCDPFEIQFFKSQGYNNCAGAPIALGSFENLGTFLNTSKKPKKIFYQRLSMKIDELENKKQFKCAWLSSNLKDEKELVLYPNKNGTVKTLLDEAARQIEFSDDSTRKLRIVEILNHRIVPGPEETTLLESIQNHIEGALTGNATQHFYRIEEIPKDELELKDDEILIPVSHFSKEHYNTFGIPFFVKAKQGETFAILKERIQKKLNLPDKEWEKYKFAIVTRNVDYIEDDTKTVDILLFRPSNSQATQPYFGLDHINKLQKRSRYTYLEKAIKIYN